MYYEAMLNAVRAGTIGTIISYFNSRLTRRPKEWLELIDEMEKLAQIVERVLSTKSVDVLETKNASALTLVVHMKEPDNPLVEHPKDAAWLDEHPAKTPMSLPVAVTGDGEKAWNFPTRHTV